MEWKNFTLFAHFVEIELYKKIINSITKFVGIEHSEIDSVRKRVTVKLVKEKEGYHNDRNYKITKVEEFEFTFVDSEKLKTLHHILTEDNVVAVEVSFFIDNELVTKLTLSQGELKLEWGDW